MRDANETSEATPKEVAHREGVVLETVYRWVWKGRIRARRVPNGPRGRLRIAVDEDGHPLPLARKYR